MSTSTSDTDDMEIPTPWLINTLLTSGNGEQKGDNADNAEDDSEDSEDT